MNTTKIIKGVVNSGRYTVTVPIVKEDYGLYLKIDGGGVAVNLYPSASGFYQISDSYFACIKAN